METVSRKAATFLLNSLWQVALVLAVAYAGSIALRTSPARYRHRLWVSALLISLGLPLASLLPGIAPLIFMQPSGPLSVPTFWFKTHAILAARAVSLAQSWSYGLLWLYCAFLAFRGFQFAWAWRRTQQLRRSSHAGDFPPAVRTIIDRCRSAYNVSEVSVRYSKLARGPLALGIRNHIILLPEDALQFTTEPGWVSIFAHEMAHIRRQDFLKNLIYELFYWPLSSHPAAMFMRKQIAATRELACDEMATQRLIDPVRYAHSLIGLATFRRKNKA